MFRMVSWIAPSDALVSSLFAGAVVVGAVETRLLGTFSCLSIAGTSRGGLRG